MKKTLTIGRSKSAPTLDDVSEVVDNIKYPVTMQVTNLSPVKLVSIATSLRLERKKKNGSVVTLIVEDNNKLKRTLVDLFYIADNRKIAELVQFTFDDGKKEAIKVEKKNSTAKVQSETQKKGAK